MRGNGPRRRLTPGRHAWTTGGEERATHLVGGWGMSLGRRRVYFLWSWRVRASTRASRGVTAMVSAPRTGPVAKVESLVRSTNGTCLASACRSTPWLMAV
uniref:Uncharacterized protein n=1 Tax=Hyaloperonospora arabidopsidis (strain Emoy2) TaxID=559515 RepID=M4BL63_HYAAE